VTAVTTLVLDQIPAAIALQIGSFGPNKVELHSHGRMQLKFVQASGLSYGGPKNIGWGRATYTRESTRRYAGAY